MRKVFAGIIGVLVVGVLFVTLGGSAQHNPTEVTEEIGARWDTVIRDGWVTPAAFEPRLTKTEAITIAKTYLKERDNWDADALQLPVRTTVGLFTGQTEDGGPWVDNIKARIVVFDNLPLAKTGPQFDAPYDGMVRFTMVIDDLTGKFVYGTIISRSKGSHR